MDVLTRLPIPPDLPLFSVILLVFAPVLILGIVLFPYISKGVNSLCMRVGKWDRAIILALATVIIISAVPIVRKEIFWGLSGRKWSAEFLNVSFFLNSLQILWIVLGITLTEIIATPILIYDFKLFYKYTPRARDVLVPRVKWAWNLMSKYVFTKKMFVALLVALIAYRMFYGLSEPRSNIATFILYDSSYNSPEGFPQKNQIGIEKEKILSQIPSSECKETIFKPFTHEYAFSIKCTRKGIGYVNNLSANTSRYLSSIYFDTRANILTHSLPLTKSSLTKCRKGWDCIKVEGNCCGCGGGGTAGTINAKYYLAWNAKQLFGRGCLCLGVMSNHWTCFATPRCVEGKCVLVENSQDIARHD